MVKLFNWNLKLWAVVVVIIVVLAGTGVALSNNTHTEDTAIVVSRVNTEGSGIFGNDAGMVTIDKDTGVATLVAEKWKGKIVATPGAASIQDVMIKEQLTKVGLSYVAYQEGQTPDPDKVTIWPCGVVAMRDKAGSYDAGITWEPWYSQMTLKSGYFGLCTTDQLEGYDNHACCMIDVNSSYYNSNQEATIRFLAAMIEAVDWINNAKTNTGSAEYKELVEIAKTHTGITDDTVIRSSLTNVTYTYDLTNFADEYADLINKMTQAGQINKTMSSLGTTAQNFANDHINSTPLTAAKVLEKKEYSSVSIKVAYLNADIHQVALRVAMEKGFFTEYNVNVSLIGYSAGPAVLNALISGEVNIGLAGAPPTIIYTVNMAGGA